MINRRRFIQTVLAVIPAVSFSSLLGFQNQVVVGQTIEISVGKAGDLAEDVSTQYTVVRDVLGNIQYYIGGEVVPESQFPFHVWFFNGEHDAPNVISQSKRPGEVVVLYNFELHKDCVSVSLNSFDLESNESPLFKRLDKPRHVIGGGSQ